MADLTLTQRSMKPLPGALVRACIAGGAVDFGDVVRYDSNGRVIRALADAAGNAKAIGIAISVGSFGALSAVAGDAVDVAYLGPVTGFSGATPGTDAFLSNTAGKVADAAGTVSKKLGVMADAATLLILHTS